MCDSSNCPFVGVGGGTADGRVASQEQQRKAPHHHHGVPQDTHHWKPEQQGESITLWLI